MLYVTHFKGDKTMKNIRKITAFILAFAAIALSACGNGESEAVTEASSETVTASEETVVTESEKTTAESTETTVSEESSESETEETTENIAYELFHQVTPNNITSPEVIKGSPEVCDIDAIMASRRDDMFKFADPYPESYYDEEKQSIEYIYKNAVEYAESYFGYSFDNASPVISYVKYDFDLDGKDEYYLCMVEYLNKKLEEYYDDGLGNQTNFYDAASLFSVYYIEDTGEYQLALGELLKLSAPEASLGPYTVSEDDMLFEVLCGYECYMKPQIIDYGDSRQLFWDQAISYPIDYGADLFWGSKHLRIAYSEPNEKLRGFCDYKCIEYGVTAEQEADFYLSGGVPESADLNYLDENNYIVWNGSEYLHSCIAYDKESGTSEFTVKDEVMPWDIRE